jgi:hypothetical protein
MHTYIHANKKRREDLIILRQIPKTRHAIRARKIGLIGQLRHKPVCPRLLIAPLGRRLGLPSPIEPAHGRFERGELRLGVRLQPQLVVVAVVADGGVGVGAAAGVAFKVAVGRCAAIESALPACAGVDVVEVCGTVGVGLGEFAADGWAPSMFVSMLYY